MTREVDLAARRRKGKALLAGGTVLGLGAAVTLAAWTDDVWVSGSFSAGTFNVQGAVDAAGTNWQEYNTSADPGPLAFTVPPAAMAPGDSVYAPLNLRIGPEESELNGAITLPTAPTGPATVSAANTAFFNALTVTLFNVPPTECSEADTSMVSPLEGYDNAPLTTVSTGPTPLLTLDSDMTPQGVCFQVTLPLDAPADVQGGATGALNWNFHAESVEP